MALPVTSGRVLGRYALFEEIAAGGMATLHVGRLLGPAGFTRTVAIKRLHPQFAKDPEFVSMFLDEARLAARVRHPNVVSILDVVTRDGELFLVMDYVKGESLARLARLCAATATPIALDIASAIAIGMLAGLHAAHEATDEHDEPLGIVHRDVSPQNVLIGTDGVTRLIDFGIAKAARRLQTTREGQFKGKLAYMAPEQLLREPIDRRCDIYAASVVLWQALTGERPFDGDEASLLYEILNVDPAPPSAYNPKVSPELDAIVLRGMARDRERRFPTALQMAHAIEQVVRPASALAVGAWVERTARDALRDKEKLVVRIEGATPSNPPDIGGVLADASNDRTVSRAAEVSTVTSILERTASRRSKRSVPLIAAAVGLVAIVVAQIAMIARSRASAPLAAKIGVEAACAHARATVPIPDAELPIPTAAAPAPTETPTLDKPAATPRAAAPRAPRAATRPVPRDATARRKDEARTPTQPPEPDYGF